MPITSEAVKELVRTCCVGGLESQALHLLTAEKPSTAKKTATIVPVTNHHDADEEIALPALINASRNSICWEPLIYYFSAVRGAEIAAEDALTLMMNMGLQPTTRIADACILGLLQQKSQTLQIIVFTLTQLICLRRRLVTTTRYIPTQEISRKP